MIQSDRMREPELGLHRAGSTSQLREGRLLEVRGLTTHFQTRDGIVRAVDDVSFDVNYGETLGLVGESGCGKSVTALSIARLIRHPPGPLFHGEILLAGVDLMSLSAGEMRLQRGRAIGFIFQDPMTSLNPTLTIGRQLSEAPKLHLGLSRRAATDRAVDLLTKVGIPRARERMDDYPYQFSGGMRQRVMIAIALSCEPALLLADEPTTALDVTIQAQILDLLTALADEIGTAVILITHDLGVAAGTCQRINVMYAGRIVESGAVDEIFDRPRMPYTTGLLDSVPRLDATRRERLHVIQGQPPDLSKQDSGCRFAPRCEYARSICRASEPRLTPRQGVTHLARCYGSESGGWIA